MRRTTLDTETRAKRVALRSQSDTLEREHTAQLAAINAELSTLRDAHAAARHLALQRGIDLGTLLDVALMYDAQDREYRTRHLTYAELVSLSRRTHLPIEHIHRRCRDLGYTWEDAAGQKRGV